MANDRTILKHEDPSKETWETTKNKVRSHLVEKARIRGLGLKYQADEGSELSIGWGRTKAPTIGASPPVTGGGPSPIDRRKYLGLELDFDY